MSKKIVGIMGGSGLYEMEGLKNIRHKTVQTPFGDPSDQLVTGELEGVEFVFLPRHGRGHMISPSEINYRANIFAMKTLGAQYLLSLSAAGSMKEEICPGDLVIVDQFIDRTKGIRKHTFFEGGLVGHVSFGDPVCIHFSNVVYTAAKNVVSRIHKGGAYLCMEGPQFSTRAESLLYRSWGVSVIGMTNMPEAKLAREAELCYASIAFSADYDWWREGEEEVSADKVLAVIKKNVETAKRVVKALPSFIPEQRRCKCAEALKFAIISDRQRIPEKLKQDLKPLIGKYL